MPHLVQAVWRSHFLVNLDDNEWGFGSHVSVASLQQACRVAQEHSRPNRVPKIREVHLVEWSGEEPLGEDAFCGNRPYHKSLVSSWFWVVWNSKPHLITLRQRYFHDNLRKSAGASRSNYWDEQYWSHLEDPSAIRWKSGRLGDLLTGLLGPRTFVHRDSFEALIAGNSPTARRRPAVAA